jgi:predicted PurR-regulated permease PerM
METLKIIFDYLLIIVGITALVVLLYAIIAGTIQTIINRKKAKELEKDLDTAFDDFITKLKEEIEKEEAEQEKKNVKKTTKKKNDE